MIKRTILKQFSFGYLKKIITKMICVSIFFFANLSLQRLCFNFFAEKFFFKN